MRYLKSIKEMMDPMGSWNPKQLDKGDDVFGLNGDEPVFDPLGLINKKDCEWCGGEDPKCAMCCHDFGSDEECEECNGEGQHTCNCCNGQGDVPCVECHPNWTRDSDEPADEDCNVCYGSGVQPCYDCEGSGNVTCQKC